MNHIAKMLALALVALCCAFPALAQVTADGTVECGVSALQTAAAGGMVAEVCVQPGDRVQAGDAVATLATTPVYAPCDGTVEVIFAEVGEDAGAATDKYGGALTLMPESRYTIYASAEYAYESARTSRIAAGQTVYLKCTADGTHRGTGVITGIDGEVFTIEATGGSFYNGETVYAYMEDDYDAADRLGKGTVVASSVLAVAGDGDVAKLYVQEGDFVEKGQLLLETVGAMPEDMDGEGLTLSVETGGYVTSVYAGANAALEAGAPLLAVCPEDGLVAAVQVHESDLSGVSVGAGAALRFALSEETLSLDGIVESIGYLPGTDASGNVGYEVRIAFDADPRIVPGMSVTVTVE